MNHYVTLFHFEGRLVGNPKMVKLKIKARKKK
jgi:hypothetical protein